MTNYPRNAYPDNPLSGVDRNAEHGWGPGWPDCQTDRMRMTRYGDVTVSVRLELVDLVRVLMTATVERFGYQLHGDQCWGFACRPIRNSDPPAPSNHSRGRAVDLNAEANPFSRTFTSDIPPGVVAMWSACGWFWGGYYSRTFDTMHFEYVRRPEDVPADLARALAYLEDIDMASAETIERKIDDLARVLGLRYDVDAQRYTVETGRWNEERSRWADEVQRDAQEAGLLGQILAEVKSLGDRLPPPAGAGTKA